MNLKKLDIILSYLAIPVGYAIRVIFFFRKPAQKTLILRPGGMGDLVALTQAMGELNINLKSYHFLIEKRSEVWAKYLELDYSCYNHSPLKTLLSHAGKFKEVINTEQRFGLSHIYAIACSSPSSNITAFKTNRLSFLALNQVDYDPHNTHEVLSFARIFNPSINPCTLIKDPQNKDADYCVVWIAGGNSPSRTMKPEDFQAMLKNIDQRKISIVSAPVDKEFAEQVKSLVEDQFDACDHFKGSFIEACNHLSHAALLVTVDSSPVHIASYFGIKTHAIFTSGVINKWHPLSRESIIYRNEEAKCAPCTLFGQIPPCPHSYLCKSINFKNVYRVEDFCPIFS